MPSQSRKLNRQQFPAGRDGQQLVLETNSPNGIAWRDRSSSFSSDIDMNSNKITELGTPSASTDAATKAYVDATHLGGCHMTANKSWAAGAAVLHASLNKGAETWLAAGLPITWTVPAAQTTSWAEVGGNTGEFLYAGTYSAGGTRTILVSWNMNLWYYGGDNYTSVMGRIQYKPSAGVYSIVDGSAQSSSFDYYGTVYLGNYYYDKFVSGSAIVTIAPGSKIKFEYGFKSWAGSGTFNMSAYTAHNITLNVTPLD
jgi:hypothetical protein